MQRVRIVCLDKDKRSIVSELHKAGLLDLRKSALDLSDDNAMEHFIELSNMEIRLAGAIALLKKPKMSNRQKRQHPEPHLNATELLARLSDLDSIGKIYSLSDERKRAQQSLKQLEIAKDTAGRISGIEVNLDGMKSDVLDFGAYVAQSRKEIKKLKDEITRKRLPVEIIESTQRRQLSIFLAYKKGIAIGDLEREYRLRQLDLSFGSLRGRPSIAYKDISNKINEESEKIKRIDAEVAAISKADYKKLSAFMEMLAIEITKAQVSEKFKRTDKTVIIEGWAPKKKINGLESAVAAAANGKYYMEKTESDELAPTLMNRPKILRPFDYMINFLSVPRSDELDPAIPFMISFPIFYGLMVTDVGYGVLSFLFAWYITRITDPDGLVYNTAKIWQLCAISAIFFGVLSNQYFGLALNQYIIPGFTGFDWLKSVTTIILISVIFGLVQVSVGLAFGFINNYKHHKKVAFSRLTSIFVLVAGSLAIAGGIFNVVDYTMTLIATGIAIASLVITIILSGEEAGEITNLISHPLSYVRIMGFGLASIVLAFLIDMAFTPRISGGPVLFVVYLIVFIILHFLNMIVTMFEAAVQGARLNFIEFFTKFYKGGGIKYNPFAAKRVYTKE